MKLHLSKILLILFFLSSGLSAQIQKNKTGLKDTKKYPASFTINKEEFDHIFSLKQKELISSKNNSYLDKSTVLVNTLNGDTRFMKIRLNYFRNAYLMIQVNGEYSTQVFILSDDKSVFYKGKPDKGGIVMSKCNEDDIVSE